MRLYLTITAKNLIRRSVYLIYSYYEKWLKNKLTVYDLQTIALIKKLPKDAVCVDVGVNEGQLFGTMYSHCSSGKLYGFEPIPHLYQYLRSKYSGSRVDLRQAVVSDREETVTFFYFPNRTGVSGMSRRGSLLQELKAEELSFQSRTLDDTLALDRLDLLKIDVEGAELKVLRGAEQLIRRCKPVIVFECGYGGIDFYEHSPEDVFDFFEGLGYRLSLIRGYLDGLQPLDRHSFIYLFRNGYEYQYVAHP